jgi:hypothetical protein
VGPLVITLNGAQTQWKIVKFMVKVTNRMIEHAECLMTLVEFLLWPVRISDFFRRSWNFQLLCPDFRFFSIKKAQIRTGLVGVKGLTLSRNLGKDEIILSQKKWETDNNSEAIQNWHLSD